MDMDRLKVLFNELKVKILRGRGNRSEELLFLMSGIRSGDSVGFCDSMANYLA